MFVAANNIASGYNTTFSVIRYGDILFSKNSAINYFETVVTTDGLSYISIADREMTRFWNTLEESVDFVIKSISIMQGGEIFIPKSLSILMINLANLIPNLSIKYVGLLEGERLHETLCPVDDSHLTYEFETYYLIKPSIIFYSRDSDFSINLSGEQGKLVESGFQYRSDNNNFLPLKQLEFLNIT